jgi:uncharacterized protein YoaH (UPF0181 family)
MEIRVSSGEAVGQVLPFLKEIHPAKNKALASLFND